MLKIDLHTHAGTDADHHLDYSPRQLIDRMAKLGYDILSITSHRKLTFSSELRRYAAGKGILLIPGTEARIEKKEVILINASKEIAEKIRTFADLERYKSENIFVMAPHPYYPDFKSLYSKLLKNIRLFDGIEFSHFYLKWWTFNTKAAEIAERYRLPLIGTSDCHMFEQLNRTYTMVDSEKNVDSIFEALRKRKLKIVTEPLPFFKAMKIIIFIYFKY